MKIKSPTILLLVGLTAILSAACGLGNDSNRLPDSVIEFRPNSCLMPTCEEVPVRKGDVTHSVASDGVLQYVNRADLRFGSDGRIEKVNVKVGDVVRAGDILVSLDVRPLELAVAEARKEVKVAEEALTELTSVTTSTQLLAATERVELAKDVLDRAKLELDIAKSRPTEHDVAQARAEVSAAQKEVLDLEAELDLVKNGATIQTLSRIEADIAASKSALLLAEIELAQLEAGHDVATFEEARDKVSLAKADLAAKKEVLNLLESGPNPDKIEELKLEFAKASLDWAQSEEEMNDLKHGKVGSDLEEDEFLFTFRRLKAQIELDTLRLEVAKEALAQARRGATEFELAQARADVSNAQVALLEAQEELDALLKGPSQEEIAKAKAEVAKHESALKASEQELDEVSKPADPLEINAVLDRLALARVILQSSETALANLGPDPLIITSRQLAVDNAIENLLEAEENLDKLINGHDPLEVEVMRGEVEVARSKLAQAEHNLNNAVVFAPFDGIVSSVNVEYGQSVRIGADPLGRGRTIVQLVDTSTLEMVSLVSEVDVNQVKIGQQAKISITALPEQKVMGTIVSVSASPVNMASEPGEDTFFEVVISGEAASLANLNLLEGMTASAEIVIDQRSDVLYIPFAALLSDETIPSVEIARHGGGEVVRVIPGLKNSRFIEVTEGLAEGDVVRINRAGNGLLPIN